MTPSFSLLLDHDGIVLLQYKDDRWHRLGAVSLDQPDFLDALAGLRETADSVAGTIGLRSALVLPNSQILYTDTEAGTDARDNARRVVARLDGATPYPLEELVFDWTARDGRLHIAAVARETLEEAESFASQNGFEPVCFTATPEIGDYPGVPSFGPCEGAAGRLAPGESLEPFTRPIIAQPERDSLPDREGADQAQAISDGAIPDATEPDVPDAPEPGATSGPHDGEDADMAVAAETGTPAPEETDNGPAPERGPEQVAPSANSEATLPGEAATGAKPDLAGSDGPTEVVLVPAEGPTPEAESDAEADKPVASVSDDGPAIAFTSIRPALEPPVKAPPGKRKIPAKPSSMAKLAAPATPSRGRAKRIEPPVSAKPQANRTETPTAPSPAGGSTTIAAAVAAAKSAPALQADRSTEVQDAPSLVPSGAVAPSSPREASGLFPGGAQRSADLREAEALTVFGARKSQRGSGTGLRKGMIAASAAIGAVGLALLWGFSAGTNDEDPASPSAELIAEAPGAPAVSLGTESSASQPAPLVETAPAPSVAQQALLSGPASETADNGAADDALAGSASDAPVEDLTRPAIAADAATVGVPAAQLASLSTSGLAPDDASVGEGTTRRLETDVAPQSAPLDPVSARAAYAVSGIWQRAPELSFNHPGDGALDDFYIASIDPSVLNQDAFAMPGLDFRPDATPEAPEPPIVPGPGASGTDTERDADGIGAVSAPGGVDLRPGPPAIIPPKRPAALAPATLPATEPAPAADESLLGFRPRTRPGDLTEATEKAQLGGRTRTELSQLRPRTRPESVQQVTDALVRAALMADAETQDGQAAADAEASAEAVLSPEEAALAVDLATATSRAVAASPEPRLRPANIAQIADRARQRADREAQERAFAEQKAREEAEAVALERARDAARDAREAEQARLAAAKAAEEKARQEAERAALAAKEAEAEESASSGPAVPRSQRASPTAPSSATVAKQATEKNALALNKVSLIGVYGTSSSRRALVRLPSGRYVKVKVGDRIDGGRVASIGQSDLRYQKGNRTVTLKMPKG